MLMLRHPPPGLLGARLGEEPLQLGVAHHLRVLFEHVGDAPLVGRRGGRCSTRPCSANEIDNVASMIAPENASPNERPNDPVADATPRPRRRRPPPTRGAQACNRLSCRSGAVRGRRPRTSAGSPGASRSPPAAPAGRRRSRSTLRAALSPSVRCRRPPPAGSPACEDRDPTWSATGRERGRRPLRQRCPAPQTRAAGRSGGRSACHRRPRHLLWEEDLGDPGLNSLEANSVGSSSVGFPSRLRRTSQYTRPAIAAAPMASSSATD